MVLAWGYSYCWRSSERVQAATQLQQDTVRDVLPTMQTKNRLPTHPSM